MGMILRWLTPVALRGRTVRLGRQAGMTVAVTSAGELILRLPLGKADTLPRLRAWRIQVETGTPSPVLTVVAMGTAFQHRVWKACREIPAGQTQTYGILARRIRCRSAQAVGQALGANPLAQSIPCHRVTSATGVGGFAWGVRRKNAWLMAEANGTTR